mgnify:CR=1 FL=1
MYNEFFGAQMCLKKMDSSLDKNHPILRNIQKCGYIML